MKKTIPPVPVRSLDERGVALPLALFGLVLVSLLVTSALVTSSTEVALSRAHQQGARALYAADSALELFIAERAAIVTTPEHRLVSGAYALDLGSGAEYALTVAELHRTPTVVLPSGELERREIFSILAEPGTGHGRSVGALIETLRTAAAVSFNIDAGLTLGTNTSIGGNARVSDGSSPGAACDSAAAPAAIRHSSDAHVDWQSRNVIGEVIEDSRDAVSLMSHILNGSSLEELSRIASIRFGPMFGSPAFSGTPLSTAEKREYRWGCPAQLVVGCSPEQAAYFPVVVLDAQAGQIDLTGGHAQGVLVIRNGNLHIRGNFLFTGILLVEGTLRVTGTPRIEGGVIVTGEQAIIDPGDESDARGNALVRYNQCELIAAQQGMAAQTLEYAPQLLQNRTFAWFEVVR